MNALELAKLVVAYFNQKGEPITPKKLQKLLYYVEAWHLANYQKPLIHQEFEAWPMGPVVRDVYHCFKSYGYMPICLEGADTDESLQEVIEGVRRKSLMDEDTFDLVIQVLTRYSHLSALELELLTHSEQPWIEARRGLKPHENSVRDISKKTMALFYGRALEDYADGQGEA